jgi:hypothetical protein
MKKNLSLIAIAILMAGCTILKQPTETDLLALSKAEKYSKAAQVSYLKCSYQWPDTECVQHNWDTYGSPEIQKASQEEWKLEALAFIKAMEMQGVANILRENGYQCNKIHYFDNFIFSSSKHAICDDGLEYKIKYKNNSWLIEALAAPKNEVSPNGSKK